MLRQTTIILLILTSALTSLTSKQDKLATDFQTGVDSFIKKYSADFTTVTGTFNSNGNDFILDKKVKTSWSKTVTLKSKTAFKNKYDQTVYQRLFLGFYQYDTDKQCSAALDSLLNCIGTDCGKLKWGDKGKSLKTTPTIYLINEREIIVCKIYCEHTNDFWTTFKNDLTTTFTNTTFGIIDLGCGGPINFKSLNAKSDSIEVTNISQQFFDWYISSAKEKKHIEYSPTAIKISNGMTSLDFTKYFQNLTLHSFSDALLEKEKLYYKDCIDNLAKIKYSDYLNLRDLDDFEKINCDYDNSYRWTGGQEMFDGYFVTETQFKKDIAIVIGQLFDKDTNNIEVRTSGRVIITTFTKQNDNWKISDISY
jgi:hypothetical protein